MTDTVKLPKHLTRDEKGVARDRQGNVHEYYEGEWREVVNAGRWGWWRYHDHYDRNGYCDSPARGY